MPTQTYTIEVVDLGEDVPTTIFLVSDSVIVPPPASQMQGVPTYYQSTQPSAAGPWLWWDTHVTGKLTLWINDGQP